MTSHHVGSRCLKQAAPRISGLLALAVALGCGAGESTTSEQPAGEARLSQRHYDGKAIFRFDTYGDERLWTDTLHISEVVATQVSPLTALAVGLKVDADALPPGILGTADLNSPQTTVALLALNAVVGLQGTVDESGNLVELGVTCALCHSTVDDSVIHGVGHRLDGWPNRDLDPGLIISLSPVLSDAQRQVYTSWGPGWYDPRYNIDGINDPVLIPPAYGLKDVSLETYTGEGPISYWNAYVAVTQMGAKGDFSDPRLGISIVWKPDLVTSKLPALLDYQLSLPKPPPPAGSFDAGAAERGHGVFQGPAGCASCHAGSVYTDAAYTLHAPAETGMEPLYASRGATGLYRTTPLRALWQHAPYFHDGSAATLEDVVLHYDSFLGLGLSSAQRSDLVEFLKSL